MEGSDNLHYKLFETARIALTYGIDHNILAELFCELVMSQEEKTLIYNRPEVRNNLTELIKYLDQNGNKYTGPELEEGKARRYLSQRLARKNTDLRIMASELKVKYITNVIRKKRNYHTLSLDNIEILNEQISKEYLMAELKLNYRTIYQDAIKFGYITDSTLELCTKIQGLFIVYHQDKKYSNQVKMKGYEAQNAYTDPDTDEEKDTDPDTYKNSDTDPDTDTDPEKDTDQDTDKNSDTDPETDTDPEKDTDLDTDENSDTDPDTDTDPEKDTDLDTDKNSDTDPEDTE